MSTNFGLDLNACDNLKPKIMHQIEQTYIDNTYIDSTKLELWEVKCENNKPELGNFPIEK